jgi:hypothetical protein
MPVISWRVSGPNHVRLTDVTRLIRAQRFPGGRRGQRAEVAMQPGPCTERGRARHFLLIAASILACEEAGPVRRRKQGSGGAARALPSVAALTGMPCLWSNFAQTPIVRFDSLKLRNECGRAVAAPHSDSQASRRWLWPK